MSLSSNKRYAARLVKAIDQTPRFLIAYTGLFFYQEVVKAHISGELGGFDSGQGALNWRLKFYSASVKKRKPKVMWGYRYKGKVVRPKSPAGYKSQRGGISSKALKPVVLSYLIEESMKAFVSRPKGFTSFVVYNPISKNFPGFEPGSPVWYVDNVFGEMTSSTLGMLLKRAKAKAEATVLGILTGDVK
jgi:hypothetical protein